MSKHGKTWLKASAKQEIKEARLRGYSFPRNWKRIVRTALSVRGVKRISRLKILEVGTIVASINDNDLFLKWVIFFADNEAWRRKDNKEMKEYYRLHPFAE